MIKLHRKILLLLVIAVQFMSMLVIGTKQNVVHAQDQSPPYIEVYEDLNLITAHLWPDGVTLTGFIDNDQDLENGILWQDEIISEEAWEGSGWVSGFWDLGEDFDLEPGHYITITDYQTTKVLLVEPLSFDWIDEVNDTAGGYGPAYKQV